MLAGLNLRDGLSGIVAIVVVLFRRVAVTPAAVVPAAVRAVEGDDVVLDHVVGRAAAKVLEPDAVANADVLNHESHGRPG